MSFFEKVTTTLQQKWLAYFEANQEWLTIDKTSWVETPDAGQRPPSYLILGVVNALEPRLSDLMTPFCKLNADPDRLIEVLGLNFDPEQTNNLHRAEITMNGHNENGEDHHSSFAEVNEEELDLAFAGVN
jgi:cell shape-determining protein MreC